MLTKCFCIISVRHTVRKEDGGASVVYVYMKKINTHSNAVSHRSYHGPEELKFCCSQVPGPNLL